MCHGDVVMLNSGGPLMTIIEVSDDTFGCAWFTVDETLMEVELPKDAVFSAVDEDDDFDDDQVIGLAG